ncbi:hypothetical protein K488DRAFT_26712, partial [Vararia minispora EC-137]
QPTTSIFVGQLSWNIDNDWLKSEFEQCGEVTGARVQMDRNTGRSRGFGYVDFATPEAAERAIELNGKEIDGRPIKVDRSTRTSGDNKFKAEKRARAFGDQVNEPSSVLFVGNIPWNADQDALYEVFADYGEIKNVRIPTDRDSGKPKGYAYVEFGDVETAKKALEGAAGQEINGRPIRLDFDYSSPRDNSGS